MDNEVSLEAQKLHEQLNKTMKCTWAGADIIVYDQVSIIYKNYFNF